MKTVVDHPGNDRTVTVFAYTHFQNFASFFQNFTNPRTAHTKCKMPHISCKMKHCIQNISNTSQKQTFVLRCKHLCHNIYFWISHIHSYSKPKALLSWAPFLYMTESNWQRVVEKFTVNTKARQKRELCVFCFAKWKLSRRPRISVWFCRFGVWFWCLSVRFQKLCGK